MTTQRSYRVSVPSAKELSIKGNCALSSDDKGAERQRSSAESNVGEGQEKEDESEGWHMQQMEEEEEEEEGEQKDEELGEGRREVSWRKKSPREGEPSSRSSGLPVQA